MLITLNYRLPRDHADALLGHITAYPLTAGFRDAWDELPANRDSDQPRLRPYRSLATGLCAATGRPVRLFGERDLAQKELDIGARMLLLTDKPFGYRLPIAVKTWEQHIRCGSGPSTLAPLLPEPEPARPLREYITFRPDGVPGAPGWVFRVGAWQVMRHLASTTLRVDGSHPLPLRLDTDGSLLAWETCDLITNRAANAYAMARIAARLVTNPGLCDLVLCVSAHLSRIAGQWAGVKNTWIAREAPCAPILRLPVHHRRRTKEDPWRHLLSPAVPKILEACDLEPITLPDALPNPPGNVRPQVARNWRHPLGNGLGARFMLRLHEHITEHLPALEPLDFEPDKRIRLAKRVRDFPDGALPAHAIDSTCYQRVTFLCLYATPAARGRMLSELETLTGQRLQSLADSQIGAVNDRLTVITRHCPNLLAHGPVNRAALLAGNLAGPGLERDPSNLVAAWVETEFHPQMVPIDRDSDAKRHLRRLLGLHGVPCQFLATEPPQLPDGIKPLPDVAKHYAARSALRDLLRTAGILDPAVSQAAAHPHLAHRLERPALLVGIHARRQQTGDGDPRLVLVLVAIHATPDPAGGWRTVMYRDNQKAWLPVGAATADFHARRLGDPRLGRSDEKAARTRAHVERQLAQLADDHGTDLPMVIFVDAPSARTIWPGLQDRQFGRGPLPGDSLHDAGRDVAVVRSNNGPEIGRPVTRRCEGNNPQDPLQPAAPGRRVYQLNDSTQPVWLFPGISKTYGAKGGAAGAHYTRWTLPEHLSSERRKPWHSYTATEIAVIRSGRWEPVALAALTARLRDQSPSWDGRVVYATPLHPAVTADKEHPDYRAATPQVDAGSDSETSQDQDEYEEVIDTGADDQDEESPTPRTGIL